MDENVLKEAVKGQLDKTKEEIQADLRTHIDDATAAAHKSTEDKLVELRTELMKKFADDPEDPKAKAVVEMEKRLVESETKQKQIEEELRLMKAKPMLPAGVEGADVPAEQRDWGGRFIPNIKVAKKYLRSYWLPDYAEDPEVRALGSGLFSSGGKLPATVADAFIDFLVDKQATLSQITTIRMNAPEGHTDELRVGSRKMRKATEATAPTVADSITTKRRTLTTIEVIWAEDITLTLLEDAIERAGTEGHIARMIGTGFGNDTNDLFWNGDTSLSDPFLSINDGLLKKLQNSVDSDVNDYDGSASPVPTTVREVLQAMLQTMDVNFLGRTDHRFFTTVKMAQIYADEVSARETALGDSVMINGLPSLRYFGIPLNPDSHLASASQRCILTPTTNLFHGIQRVFRVDTEWQPRTRVIEYTLTARNDFEYATGQAVVNGKSIPTDLC